MDFLSIPPSNDFYTLTHYLNHLPFIFSPIYQIVKKEFRFIPAEKSICNTNLQHACPAFNCKRAHIRTHGDTLVLTDLNLELHKFASSSFQLPTDLSGSAAIRIINRHTTVNTTINTLCSNNEPRWYDDLPRCDNTSIHKAYSFGANGRLCDYDIGKYTNSMERLYKESNLAAIGPFTINTKGFDYKKLDNLLNTLSEAINNKPAMPILMECPEDGKQIFLLQTLLKRYTKTNPIIWLNLDRLAAGDLMDFMERTNQMGDNYYFALDLDMFILADKILEHRESLSNTNGGPSDYTDLPEQDHDSFINMFFLTLNKDMLNRIVVKSNDVPIGLNPEPLHYVNDLATTVLGIHNAFRKYHNFTGSLMDTNNMLNTNAFNLIPRNQFNNTSFIDLQNQIIKLFSPLNKNNKRGTKTAIHINDTSSYNGSTAPVDKINKTPRSSPAPLMSRLVEFTPSKLLAKPEAMTPTTPANKSGPKPLMSTGHLLKPCFSSTPTNTHSEIAQNHKNGDKSVSFSPSHWSSKINKLDFTSSIDISDFTGKTNKMNTPNKPNKKSNSKKSNSENKENNNPNSQPPKPLVKTPNNVPKLRNQSLPVYVTKHNNTLALSPLISKEPNREINVTSGSIVGSTVTSHKISNQKTVVECKSEPKIVKKQLNFKANQDVDDRIEFIVLDDNDNTESIDIDELDYNDTDEYMIDEEATQLALSSVDQTNQMEEN